MHFNIACPTCGWGGQVADKFHGQNVRCKKCGAVFAASLVQSVQPPPIQPPPQPQYQQPQQPVYQAPPPQVVYVPGQAPGGSSLAKGAGLGCGFAAGTAGFTIAIIVGVFVAVVAVILLILFLCCGGIAAVGRLPTTPRGTSVFEVPEKKVDKEPERELVPEK